jgi:hypothetical protein
MGNPAIPHQAVSPTPAARTRNEKNGYLAYVGGQFISDGARQLPPPSEKEQARPERVVTIEVPDLGAVRITYRLNTHRHGKSRHWHWLAVHAEEVQLG